jgi:hypothetical protein
MNRSRTALILAGVLTTGITLVACSSTSSEPAAPTSTPTPTASSTLIGGMTECTGAIIEPEVKAELAKDVQLMSFNDLSCADGWAVAGVTIGDGEHGAPTSFIFEQEGQFWIPKEQSAVCGTIDFSSTPVTRPADAQVPDELFEAACLT